MDQKYSRKNFIYTKHAQIFFLASFPKQYGITGALEFSGDEGPYSTLR
jgi:hypothetical protein